MKVLLPTPLAEYTNGAREVEAQGDTLAALLDDLERRHPGIRFRMIDEQGRARAHMRFFVNGELQRSLSAAICESDRVMVVAALSGG